jgi:hypothetical protein
MSLLFGFEFGGNDEATQAVVVIASFEMIGEFIGLIAILLKKWRLI